MRETIRGLNTVANVHVISFLDREEQREAQQVLQRYCASALFLVRPHLCLDDQWTLVPNAIREFGIRDLTWAIQRTILLENIDEPSNDLAAVEEPHSGRSSVGSQSASQTNVRG